MCRDAGIAQPKFEEIMGAALVTFRVLVGETAGVAAGSKAGSRVESKPARSATVVITQSGEIASAMALIVLFLSPFDLCPCALLFAPLLLGGGGRAPQHHTRVDVGGFERR